jgi:hypothetical protein
MRSTRDTSGSFREGTHRTNNWAVRAPSRRHGQPQASNAPVHDRGPAGGLEARPSSAREPSRKSTIPIGASGVVFGHASYLISRGFLDPARFGLAIGAVVAFVWDGVLLGGLLPQEGISWQGHFLGAVGDSWRRGCSRPRESAPAIL